MEHRIVITSPEHKAFLLEHGTQAQRRAVREQDEHQYTYDHGHDDAAAYGPFQLTPHDAKVAARDAEYVAFLAANGMPTDTDLFDALARAMACLDGQS